MSVPGIFITAALGQAVQAVSNLRLGSLFGGTPQGFIDTIAIDATIEEVLTDMLHLTEHPVETGAPISDHSYTRMPEIMMRCGWSNSGPNALLSSVGSALSSLFGGGQTTVGDYVSAVYSQLLALQQSGNLFNVTSTIRLYPNMALTNITLHRDQKTSQALMVTATMRQMRIVSTSSATLPPITNQKNPAATSEIVDTGTQNLQPGSPSPNGSVPIDQMFA